tara:strand:+ start:4436 stop:6112 length:1677 start_codon:yes stop_codon:yes gene_type:complete
MKLKFSDELHAQKYRSEGETFDDAMARVAGTLASDDPHFHTLLDILRDQRFLPGGRVQASVGATKAVTPLNCFMSGDIGDSFVSNEGHIMQRATEAAATMRLGGGIGTNFSTLRPAGARIAKLDSTSSGPLAFMEIFDAVGRAVASSGHRRGAQMGVLRVDHPDIEAFIHAKNNSTSLTGFNVSVLVTDEFMRAVQEDSTFDLTFGGQVHDTVRARPLWDAIMRSTYDYAEPGVLFIDRIQNENNLSYCEEITGTNPCGEVPLPPYGACLLGSFNLVKYVTKGTFDWHSFIEDIPPVVEALDRVISTAAAWPLPEHQREMESKRRIGIGVTGLANALEYLGFGYGSPDFCEFTSRILETLRDEAYLASAGLAEELGAFPLYDEDKFFESPFVQRLPENVQSAIREHGIRNSHLLAIAPTGTISLTADNVSSGIEPVFSHRFSRTVHMADGQRTEEVEDYGVREFNVQGRTANELTPDEHLAVVEACVPYVDQAISKTINVPADVPWEDFKNIYFKAWAFGAKGCTTFRNGGKREGILKEEPEAASCFIDPETGRRECS